MIEEKSILTVSEITGSIKRTLEGKFGYVAVRGEISNFKQHSSGHRYFSLKDEDASIDCVMWRTRRLDFEVVDGMKVVITGKVTVYPPRGNYQIDCSSMKPEGQGDLYLAFEALKKKLEKAGYFDIEHKKELPRIPLKIGIATSPTGAAVQDMKTTIARRLPACEILLRPTLTQGDEAADDIAKAIAEFQKTDVDVLIIGRGGGSIEDLWCFNEEVVADAIYHSEIPIVSAVGHEVDYTIADFVADVRAATPTAAGEIVTPYTREELLQQLDYYQERMEDTVLGRIDKYNDMIEQFMLSYNVRNFADNLSTRRSDIMLLEERLNAALLRNFDKIRERVNGLNAHLQSLNPRNPLRKGFALLRKRNGNYLYADEAILPGDYLLIERLNDKAEVDVKKVLKDKKWQRKRKPSKKNSKDSKKLSLF
jgi:exodeoxyribonuclease VII large subunit